MKTTDYDQQSAELRTSEIYPFPKAHLFNKIVEQIKQAYIDGVNTGKKYGNYPTSTIEQKLTHIANALISINDKLTHQQTPSQEHTQKTAIIEIIKKRYIIAHERMNNPRNAKQHIEENILCVT